MKKTSYDLVIVGGGLAGCLTLHALKSSNPRLRVLLIEKANELCGNHTWSFHHSEVPSSAWPWLKNLISFEWTGYDVHFPEYSRSFESRFYSIASLNLANKTLTTFMNSILLGTHIVSLKEKTEDLPAQLILENIQGEKFAVEAETVLMARGWQNEGSSSTTAWQKFVGLEVELENPHGLERVQLMDSRVQQIDGYRFFYILPISETRLLIEDTYYSNHPTLKSERIESEILGYIQKKSWSIKQIYRREQGALPLPFEKSEPQILKNQVPLLGAESGSFHPLTGRAASSILKQIEAIRIRSNLTTSSINRILGQARYESESTSSYYRMLNKLMFKGTDSALRYKVLAHFYRLPAPLIERFYAGKSSIWDKIRILFGKPPIPVGRAIQILRAKS